MSALVSQPFSTSLSETQRREIGAHLEQLLASHAFAGSRRSRQFLRYVVEETIEGRGSSIKERTIAIDVFDKGPDFDAQTDSVVRVKAAEVRKRLAMAYAEKDLQGPLQIELPVGSYMPVFRFATADERASKPVSILWLLRRRLWIPCLLVAGVFAVGVLTLRLPQSGSSTDLLWKPFASEPQPVLITLPALTVAEVAGMGSSATEAGKNLSFSGLDKSDADYVGVGAAQGAARFAEQLALRHHPFILRFGADVSFADLRQYPAVLLGAFTSRWTMELTEHLPFRLTGEGSNRIEDAANANRWWRSDPSSSPEPRTGYALITRLMRSDSGNLMLMAAGLRTHDTQSAVDFLDRPEYFDQFARQAHNWPRQNFQIVIRTVVHGNTPGPPSVVAWRVW